MRSWASVAVLIAAVVGVVGVVGCSGGSSAGPAAPSVRPTAVESQPSELAKSASCAAYLNADEDARGELIDALSPPAGGEEDILSLKTLATKLCQLDPHRSVRVAVASYGDEVSILFRGACGVGDAPKHCATSSDRVRLRQVIRQHGRGGRLAYISQRTFIKQVEVPTKPSAELLGSTPQAYYVSHLPARQARALATAARRLPVVESVKLLRP